MVAAGEPAAADAVVAPDREPVDVAFPLRLDRKAACVEGFAVTVHLARQLVIIAGYSDRKLHCYSLSDGVERSVVGCGPGAGDMQFNWSYGGVCVTPRGTLLVADCYNNRVPEVDLDVIDHFVRVFGQGDGAPVVHGPEYVDCNGVHVAVTERTPFGVCILSYADGSLVGRAGSDACGHSLYGIKLLTDGSGVVVVDRWQRHVVLLSLAGNVLGSAPLVVQSHADLRSPIGIVQCAAPDGDVAVVVTCHGAASGNTRLMKIGFRSGVLESVDMAGSGDGQFYFVYDIASLPGSGLVALEFDARRFQVFTSLALRMCWIRLAVSGQSRR